MSEIDDVWVESVFDILVSELVVDELVIFESVIIESELIKSDIVEIILSLFASPGSCEKALIKIISSK